MKLTSGQAHAKENVTVRTESAGTVTDAETAAPITVPGSEAINISPDLRFLKEPRYKKKEKN